MFRKIPECPKCETDNYSVRDVPTLHWRNQFIYVKIWYCEKCKNIISCSILGTTERKGEKSVKDFTYKCTCDWSKEGCLGFIPNTDCAVHGKKTKKVLNKCVPV